MSSIDHSIRVQTGTRTSEPDDISLAEIARDAWTARRQILLSTLAGGALAAIVAFLLPVEYTAEAVILTPQQSQSSLSTMAQLAGGGAGSGLSALGLLSGFGFHNPTDLYVGLLESRTIADTLIARFDLKRLYRARDLYAARKRLRRKTTIRSGKDTLIHVQVEDRDPQRAAKLAQAYVEELAKQNATVALTEATQRRLFFEEQLAKEKNLLSDAEVAMRDTQQSTGLVSPTGQAEALVRSLSQLHAEILVRQAQLNAMRSYVAEDNPKLVAARRELSSLQSELSRLEAGEHLKGSVEVPAGALPTAGLAYLRRYRDVKYHEAMFEILSKQYEAARLDEARASPAVQIIDRAIPPDRKSWPPRTVMILLGMFFAAVAALFWNMWTRNAKSRI